MFGRIAIGLLFVLAPPPSGLGFAQGDKNDFRWQGSLAAGKVIELIGVNGSIEAEGGTGRQVEVAASKKGHRSDPATVTFDVVEHADGVTICAVYPSRDRDDPNECRPGGKGRMNTRNNDVEVDWVVRIPEGVRFTGRTVNGKISARSLTASAEARTVNGSISIETGAWAEATTVNGSITARMGKADWEGETEFKTVNGGITIYLPATVSMRVNATNVNGSMSTDFPLTIQGRWGPRQLSGTIGEGGRTLSLTTVNGSVELRKQ